MNATKYLGLAGLLLGLETFAQEPAPTSPAPVVQQPASSPTLDETLKFIVEKVAYYGTVTYTDIGASSFTGEYSNKVENQGDCVLRKTYMKRQFLSGELNYTETGTVQIPLYQMNNHLTIDGPPYEIISQSGYTLLIISTDGTGFKETVLREWYSVTSGKQTDSVEKKKEIAGIYVTSRAIADRLKTALEHAMELCQAKYPAKAEPF